MVVGPRSGSSKWQGHEHNAGSEEVSDGFAALQGLQPHNRAEQALQEVMGLLYAHAADLRAMEAPQVDAVREIAKRCPLDDGFAVHIARAAMMSIDTLPKGYMNPCELLSPEDGEKGKQEKVADASGFAVYPNPNSGQMTIDYALTQGETGVVEIFDLLGHRVFVQPLTATEGSRQVSVDGISSGLYILTYRVNGSVKHSERISIIGK